MNDVRKKLKNWYIVEHGEKCYWLTAELPIPEVEAIAANVEKAE